MRPVYGGRGVGGVPRRRVPGQRKDAGWQVAARRQYVLRRDGNACWYCNEDIDMRLPGNVPRGPTIHHVLPVSLYPEKENDPANWRLTHKVCNQQLGNKHPDDVGHGPLKTSREW